MYCFYAHYPLFVSDFDEVSFFSKDFRKVPKFHIFIKIRLVGDVFHAEGRTDRRTDGKTDRLRDRHDKSNNRFSQFSKALDITAR
jgi:hypothetical protein